MIAVDREGFREVLAVAEGAQVDRPSWTAFLPHLKERGLSGEKLFVPDKCLGLAESMEECQPGSKLAAMRSALLSQCMDSGAERGCEAIRNANRPATKSSTASGETRACRSQAAQAHGTRKEIGTLSN